VGDEVAFLKRAEAMDHTVVLCFIDSDGPKASEERVAMRVSQGGHDVPTRKLKERYPRTMKTWRRPSGSSLTSWCSTTAISTGPFARAPKFSGGR
jgi:hypothetical protein